MDPTRFALVSLRVDGRILLHKLRARIHAAKLSKRKRARKSEFFFRHAGKSAIICRTPTVAFIISTTADLSMLIRSSGRINKRTGFSI